MIFAAFFRALGQLPDRRFQSVLWRGIGLSVALLFFFYGLLLWLINWLTAEPVRVPVVGEVTWLGDLLGFGSIVLMLVLSVFLMVPVASAITSLFLDEVADAVEQEHYAHLPPVPRLSFWESARDSVNFLGVLLVANIAALFLYVIFPFAGVPIFFALNGYLLGREYFQMAAMRRMARKDAVALRKRHSGTVWLAGCLMAIPLTVPVLNLIIPILGAATFTHIYHKLSRY